MDYESELEPYKNAEAYRNLQPATLPNHLERYLDFMDISEDGFLLMGCTNLTGRYWMGSLWYFIEPEAAPNVEKCLTGIDCDTGIGDGKFLEDQQKVIVGEDSGNVQILTLSEVAEEHTFHFSLTATACDHDDFISSISVFKGKSRALSGSADFTIKVWDVDSLVAENTYRPAHTHQVTGVAAQPVVDSPLFASCSLDGTVVYWDTRKSKPAVELLQDVALNAVQWQPTNTNVIAVGGITGDVSFIDIREPKQKLSKIKCFPRPLHRMQFDRTRSNKLAVCGDHHAVKVIDCADIANPVICYEDERHNDFVRGLSWHPKHNSLFSCGWDKQVLTHHLALRNAGPEAGDKAMHYPAQGSEGDSVPTSPQNMDINGS